jgi:hypothetical protein
MIPPCTVQSDANAYQAGVARGVQEAGETADRAEPLTVVVGAPCGDTFSNAEWAPILAGHECEPVSVDMRTRLCPRG